MAGDIPGAEDEFASLDEVASELGLETSQVPAAQRETVELADGRLSLIAWGAAPPEVIFLHGGGQNAHTWDLVAVHLGRPAIAIDLPGHGHSTWRTDQDYGPVANAESIAVAVEQLAASASIVVGMSLGGLTTIWLAARRPDLVRKAVIVDVTPGSGQAHGAMSTQQRGTTALIAGPRAFDSLEEMIDNAVGASPRRPASAVRRGVVHNTRQLADGRWAWRYDDQGSRGAPDYRLLWDDLSATTAPMMLVKGGDSAFVTPDDLAEFRRRRPDALVEEVPGAGHSVQSDRPQDLSALISRMMGD
jgi:pimeloyl-ACP methyl ester carboxylesterase